MTQALKHPSRKVTYTIRDDIFEALTVIRDEEMRMQSHIVHLALLDYLKQHYRELLAKHGIDLWEDKKK